MSEKEIRIDLEELRKKVQKVNSELLENELGKICAYAQNREYKGNPFLSQAIIDLAKLLKGIG